MECGSIAIKSYGRITKLQYSALLLPAPEIRRRRQRYGFQMARNVSQVAKRNTLPIRPLLASDRAEPNISPMWLEGFTALLTEPG
jgi:hypothetical protein